MEWVLIWVAASVLVGVWARSKGRSMGLAIFASLMFSPLVGAVIVAVWKPREEMERDAARSGQEGTYKVCPQCASNGREVNGPRAVSLFDDVQCLPADARLVGQERLTPVAALPQCLDFRTQSHRATPYNGCCWQTINDR